jgi:hypothetical protein
MVPSIPFIALTPFDSGDPSSPPPMTIYKIPLSVKSTPRGEEKVVEVSMNVSHLRLCPITVRVESEKSRRVK